jgi:hypothetical protein
VTAEVVFAAALSDLDRVSARWRARSEARGARYTFTHHARTVPSRPRQATLRLPSMRGGQS